MSYGGNLKQDPHMEGILLALANCGSLMEKQLLQHKKFKTRKALKLRFTKNLKT